MLNRPLFRVVAVWPALAMVACLSGPVVRAQDQSIPDRTETERTAVRGWGHMKQYTEGDEWYRRNLAADLKAMQRGSDQLTKAASTRSAERVANAARQARRDLSRGDSVVRGVEGSHPDDTAGADVDRVGRLVALVRDVRTRIAREVRQRDVDLRDRQETLTLLVRIEALASSIRSSEASARR